MLFNGFKPLFAALSPEDVNKLSYEIIQVFQGEGGTVESLLQSTASVTNTLADRDEIVGDLIDNLNDVLVTIGDRDQELSDLIVQLQQFVSGLKDDRQAILGSLRRRSRSCRCRPRTSSTRHRPGSPVTSGQLRRLAGHARQQPGRDRQGAPDPAAEAAEDRPHGDLRLVVQLLPLRLPAARSPCRRSPGSELDPIGVDYDTNTARCDLG